MIQLLETFIKIFQKYEWVTQNCLKVSSMVYAKIHKRIVKVSNTKAAETTKLLENVFRAVNIGLVNELKILQIN